MRLTDHQGRDVELLPTLADAYLLVSPQPRFLRGADVARTYLPATDRRVADRRQGERRRNRTSGRRTFARRTRDRLTLAEAMERATLDRRLAVIAQRRSA